MAEEVDSFESRSAKSPVPKDQRLPHVEITKYVTASADQVAFRVAPAIREQKKTVVKII